MLLARCILRLLQRRVDTLAARRLRRGQDLTAPRLRRAVARLEAWQRRFPGA